MVTFKKLFGWATLYRDLDPGTDTERIKEINGSPSTHEFYDELSRVKNPPLLKPYACKLYQLGRDSQLAQINTYRHGRTWNLSLILQVILFAYLLVTGNINAAYLHEWVFMARNLGYKARNFPEGIRLLCLPYSHARLWWRMNRDRQAPPLPLTILYMIPAYSTRMRWLYGNTWFLVACVTSTFAFTMVIQFWGESRREWFKYHIRREAQTYTAEEKIQLWELRDRYHKLTANYLQVAHPKGVSKIMRKMLGFDADDCTDIMLAFKLSLEDIAPSQSVNPRIEKLPALVMVVIIAIISIVPFFGKWLTFTQSVSWGVSACLQIFLLFSKHQVTAKRTNDRFSDIASAAFFNACWVAIPMLADPHLLDDWDTWQFFVITIGSSICMLLFSDWIIPSAKLLWKYVLGPVLKPVGRLLRPLFRCRGDRNHEKCSVGRRETAEIISSHDSEVTEITGEKPVQM